MHPLRPNQPHAGDAARRRRSRKTKAAVKYYRDNPQSTVYIRLDPSMSGLAGVGELLGAAWTCRREQQQTDVAGYSRRGCAGPTR